ncbi:hypothetical protein J7481_12510 [Labrenzia sp. R4_2]|uniref:hypothetical protein n=1 Tax=Labrenzia sp. R4_2 TaxID=2821107 RepID=UPI001ADBA496|nr:hypothetical protein [Labrenzia sp. R4_2]MBO9420319.1 hypothetical protein [Labrenzia sp. R4_2]
MQEEDQQLGPEALYKKLYEVVDRMFEAHGHKLADQRWILPRYHFQPPFDISRPNQHDSKAEFQQEYDAVTKGLEGLRMVMDCFYGMAEQDAGRTVAHRLRPIIDDKMRSNAQNDELKNSFNLIRKNIAEVVGFIGSFLVCIDLERAAKERLQVLEDQKDQFWNISHRAPDYYARFIALRLAKLFTRETGKFPTTGTSGETGDPSTSYTRALREVFDLLEISVGVRLPAEWALKQLGDDDLRLPNAFADNFGSSPFAGADGAPSRGFFSGIFSDPLDEKS